MALNIRVNGQMRAVDANAETPLLYVLTDELKLQGPRFGCGLAQCGACSVLVDGKEVKSCVIPISTLGNKSVTTLEGLASLFAKQKKLSQIKNQTLDLDFLHPPTANRELISN